jgi:uncharacterized pyridoxamine 5'-phosphate oxidase family protein
MTENEDIYLYSQDKDGTYIRVRCEDNGSLADTNMVMVAVFGELANE